MRSEIPLSHRLAAPLAYRLDDDATAAQIAAAFGVVWLELDTALGPIIGARGVAALGQRSLHLAVVVYPWLEAGAPGPPGATAKPDAAVLMPLLAQRHSDEAAAAGSSVLQNFHQMLSKLIGLSLTERLLRHVWGPISDPISDPTFRDFPVQDPSP